MVNLQRDLMKSNFIKKWVCVGVGFLIGVTLAPITMFIVSKLGLSFYNRSGLDSLLQKYFEELTFDDIFAEELLITSYEFNSK